MIPTVSRLTDCVLPVAPKWQNTVYESHDLTIRSTMELTERPEHKKRKACVFSAESSVLTVARKLGHSCYPTAFPVRSMPATAQTWFLLSLAI